MSIAVSSPFSVVTTTALPRRVLLGLTAANVVRVFAAGALSDLYFQGAVPSMVLLAVLLDGIVMGVGAPLFAACLAGGRLARTLAGAWNAVGLLSMAHVAARIIAAGRSFPEDVAVLTSGAGGVLTAALFLLGLVTHLGGLRASRR